MDCVLHNHKFPAFPAQDQQSDKNNQDGHDGTEHPHGKTHSRYLSVDFRSAVADHKNLVPLFQIFIDDQLIDAAVVPVRICIRLCAAVCPDPAKDFQITSVICLRIEQSLILMIQINTVFHTQKYIFTVRKPLDFQIQQRVHQTAGVNAGAHITDTFRVVKKRIIHGKNHASGTRRFHDSKVGKLRTGENRILEFVQ